MNSFFFLLNYHVFPILQLVCCPNNWAITKWVTNYKGPYAVRKDFSGGALILTSMDGDDLLRPVNSTIVKICTLSINQ